MTAQGSSSQAATLSVSFWCVILRSLIDRRSISTIGVGRREDNLIIMQVRLQLHNKFVVIVIFDGIGYSVSNFCSYISDGAL